MTDKSEIPEVDRDAAARRRLAEREEAETLLDLYLNALGMLRMAAE